MIKAGSYSRLAVYEQCPKRARFQFSLKIPEGERPPHPSGEHPNDRGIRVHNDAEAYVRGNGPLTTELKHFKHELEFLKKEFEANPNRIILEEMWAYTDAWEPTVWNDWANTWNRVKVDACYFKTPTNVIIVDYKTGKKWGNEVKHADQMQFYLVGAFMRYPEIETATVELWYLDHDDMLQMTFDRKQAMRFFKGFNDRLIRMTSDNRCDPKPNIHNCRFCPYKTGPVGKFGQEGTGHCTLNPDQ